MTDTAFDAAPLDVNTTASHGINHWIFQPLRPDYHLPTEIASKHEGDEDEWPVVRNGSEMRPGDQVLFYQIRRDQGAYACGELLSAPYEGRHLDGTYAGTGRPGERVVRVRYTRILPRPFGRTEMEAAPGLANTQMLGFSDCINCRVTPEEWEVFEKLVQSASRPRIWWVNQGASYEQERDGGYIRSPQASPGGQSWQHWKNMTSVRPGDLVVNYARKAVRAVSVVTRPAVETAVPDPTGAGGEVPGWRVEVDTYELSAPINLDEIPAEWRTATDGGPFNYKGGVNQGYLYPLPTAFAERFFASVSDRMPEHARTVIDSLGSSVPGHTILKVAPGEQGKYWDECLAGGFICVGWEELDDLRAYGSEQEIRTACLERGSTNNAGIATLYSRALWAYRNLQPGDLVVANRGQSTLLGIGTVVGPYEYQGGRLYYKHVIPVRWDTSSAGPIRAQGPTWRHTIVELTPEQVSEIIRAPSGDGPRNPGSFGDLHAALGAQGLYFPAELLSNYLLALQAKRFVILTGISGTGKTQLALAVAQHFRPLVEVARPKAVPEDAVEVEVQPYMVRYNRTILPVALMANLELPPSDPDGGVFIGVRYPEGRARLRVSNQGSGGAKGLLFKGALKQWFTNTLRVGDHFLLRPLPGQDAAPDELEMIIPETEAQREALPNHRVVAVRPDWTDNRGLLGYYNPITESYVVTEFLRLLLDARADEQRAAEEGRDPHPFFIILDEMNLVRVEHYFSDFLSVLESGEPIELHHNSAIEAGEDENGIAVPRRLEIPRNVFITGTVNVDETTYMFSPKVLDRAFTIEFNEVDLAGLGAASSDAGLDGSSLQLTRLPAALRMLDRPRTADWVAFGELLDGALRRVVIELNDRLESSTRHFGYRVANEIGRFVRLAAEQSDGSEESLWAALDLAILQKVLPKFHGTQQELEETLEMLFAFAVAGSGSLADEQPPPPIDGWRLRRGELVRQSEGDVSITPVLPRTAAKVWRMLDRVRKQGFTSYVE